MAASEGAGRQSRPKVKLRVPCLACDAAFKAHGVEVRCTWGQNLKVRLLLLKKANRLLGEAGLEKLPLQGGEVSAFTVSARFPFKCGAGRLLFCT